MDIRKVKKLIELLEASSVDEIEIKEGEESVRISRNTAAPIAMAAAPFLRLQPCQRLQACSGALLHQLLLRPLSIRITPLSRQW